MEKNLKRKTGLKVLMDLYRTVFLVPENLNHYSGQDYRRAERKFLKYCLEQRSLENQEELFRR